MGFEDGMQQNSDMSERENDKMNREADIYARKLEEQHQWIGMEREQIEAVQNVFGQTNSSLLTLRDELQKAKSDVRIPAELKSQVTDFLDALTIFTKGNPYQELKHGLDSAQRNAFDQRMDINRELNHAEGVTRPDGETGPEQKAA